MSADFKRFLRNVHFASWGLSLLMASIALAQAEPARDVGPPLLRVGDTWEYRHYELATGKVYRTSAKVVIQIHGDSVRIRDTNSAGEPATETDSKASELFNWRWPLFVGKSWTAPIMKDGKAIGETKYVVQGRESISTAAGTFETLHLANVFTRPEGSFQQVIWYAPAVGGIVRLYYLDKEGKAFQGTELVRWKHE